MHRAADLGVEWAGAMQHKLGPGGGAWLKRSRTSWSVTALGAIVATLGALLTKSRMRRRLGSGVLGFGLAHVVLGLLDRMRVRT